MAPRKKRTSFSGASRHGGRARNKKLINAGRRVEPLGPAFADDADAVTALLVNDVFHRAMCLKTYYSTLNGSEKSYYGQAGLIRGARLTPSPENVEKRRRTSAFMQSSCFKATSLLTALHNVINEEGETYASVKLYCASPPTTSTIAFPDGGRVLTENDLIEIRPATEEDEVIMWESRDVTEGDTIVDPGHFLTKKPLSYEKVPDGFQPRAGQKIGIAVYRRFEITAERGRI